MDGNPRGKRRRIGPSQQEQAHQLDAEAESLVEQQELPPEQRLGWSREEACDKLVGISDALVASLSTLTFQAPVTCVYNPLVYAREPYVQYVRKHGGMRVEVLLVGMNPGPFGMAQTGIPFGDSVIVRQFLGISGRVDQPEVVHPKRPIDGLTCSRREVSGQRLWGWAQKRFTSATSFFTRFWVYNFCPLAFMEASGKNRTPDKIRQCEREELEARCRHALAQVIQLLQPRLVVGVGGYARQQIERCGVQDVVQVQVGQIMHPSPANPKANKNWEDVIELQLHDLGVELEQPAT